MNEPRQPRDMSAEQWAFLVQFSADYVSGRRFLCYGARAVVAVGVLAGAVAAIGTAVHIIFGGKWP